MTFTELKSGHLQGWLLWGSEELSIFVDTGFQQPSESRVAPSYTGEVHHSSVYCHHAHPSSDMVCLSSRLGGPCGHTGPTQKI